MNDRRRIRHDHSVDDRARKSTYQSSAYMDGRFSGPIDCRGRFHLGERANIGVLDMRIGSRLQPFHRTGPVVLAKGNSLSPQRLGRTNNWLDRIRWTKGNWLARAIRLLVASPLVFFPLCHDYFLVGSGFCKNWRWLNVFRPKQLSPQILIVLLKALLLGRDLLPRPVHAVVPAVVDDGEDRDLGDHVKDDGAAEIDVPIAIQGVPYRLPRPQ